MKKVLFSFLVILLITSSIHSVNKTNNLSNIQITKSLTSMPLTFTANNGQWDEHVKFRANAGGATMWFASDGAYYQFTRTIISKNSDPLVGQVSPRPDMLHEHQVDSIETMMIKANFVGANANPQMVGVDMIEYKCNYFIGNDQSKWATDVPNYTAVMYEQIYDGIDLKYYGNGRQMEYDFIVEPGADFSQIKIQYEGAESIAVNNHGELVVTTMWGEVVEQRPVIYQVENNSRVQIEGHYKLNGASSFSFELADYNPSLPLVIDPVLEYSTYLGGGDYDMGKEICVDSSGATYITGYTYSIDFPTLNQFQDTLQGGSYDAFVTKLSSSGNSLIYSTYLGSSNGGDIALSITLDAYGIVYVTGYTYSNNFPMINPFQGEKQGSSGNPDIFVIKLNNIGNDLLYSSYLGGSNKDYGLGIAVDDSASIYISGYTSSVDFPMFNSYAGTFQGGSFDVFVTKLNNTGSNLIYSTYIGGSDYENCRGIAVDNSGSAYIAGKTLSADFPIFNPFQETLNDSSDVYVVKLSNTGDSLVYSTYIGGSGEDYCNDFAIDESGVVYLTGSTTSTDYPTINHYQIEIGSIIDAFVTKLSSTGNSLIYSTYLGGGGYDNANGIAVDDCGAAYITGTTYSTDFPILNSIQATKTSFSAGFVTKLNSIGNDLVYSTYLGGTIEGTRYPGDYCTDIAVNNFGEAYVMGLTYSTDFPVFEPYQGTFQDSSDIFITKFSNANDIDNDCVDDAIDNCQNFYNPTQTDTDLDGIGDSCDICMYDANNDFDNDGLCADVDNCPSLYNPEQTDNNSNEIGDACENCCIDLRGNVEFDALDQIDISDLVFLVAYMFQNGAEPPCLDEANIDGVAGIDISDLVGLVAYMFQGGVAPAECP